MWVVCTFPFNLGLTLAETQVTQVKEVKEVRDAQVSAVPALDFSAGIEGTTFRRHLIGINLYEICSFVALNWSRVSRESTFRLVNEIAIPVTHPCSTRVVVQMIETFRRCGQNHHVQTRFQHFPTCFKSLNKHTPSTKQLTQTQTQTHTHTT